MYKYQILKVYVNKNRTIFSCRTINKKLIFIAYKIIKKFTKTQIVIKKKPSYLHSYTNVSYF